MLIAEVYLSFQVGYRPFVEACIDADEKGEALKYIPKLADPREKAEVIKIFPPHVLIYYIYFVPFAVSPDCLEIGLISDNFSISPEKGKRKFQKFTCSYRNLKFLN